MRRLGYAVVALACAAAGALASVVLAGGVGAAGFLTTSTTGDDDHRHHDDDPLPALIPPGVTISGIPVGGLTPDEARTVVQERFSSALPLVLDRKHRLAPPPSALGAVPHYDEAIDRRATRSPAQRSRCRCYRRRVVRAYVPRVAQRFNRRRRTHRSSCAS